MNAKAHECHESRLLRFGGNEVLMKKNSTKTILITIILLLLLGAMLTWAILSKRIPENPPGTVGNTAGNLNNSGLFCQQGNVVYFSNANDNGRLYAMNADETDIHKLNNLSVCNILAGGKYLYYFQLGAKGESGLGNVITVKSFNRSSLKGDHNKSLTRDVVVTGQLVDNYLYLLTSQASGPSFYKMKITESKPVQLANYEINPACAENGVIYYNGTQDNHYLYGLDTSTDTPYEIWEGNIWYPILDGDYVYYMDVENNYRLCRYSLSQNQVQVLTQDRVDCYNVGNGYIYYQKNSATPGLICMRTDGTDAKVIADGTYTKINMTSQYVYFQQYGYDTVVYHSLIGSDNYAQFY